MTEYDQSNELPDDEKLLEELDKAPERGDEWDPEPGDTIIGTLTEIQHPKTKKGDRYLPILILETEDGPVRVAAGRQVLRDQLLEKKVQVHDRLAIRYTGVPEGKRWHGYRVAVAESGPRDPHQAFTTEPRDEDLEFTDEAQDAADEEPGF
jgi:hypothetical protein